MTVKVHAANIHDQIIAQEVLEPLIGKTPRLKAVFADLAYKKISLKNWISENLNSQTLILKHPWQGSQYVWVFPGKDPPPAPERPRGFVPLKWRWVVERTFGWFGHSRRLSKCYEYLTLHEEGMIYGAMIRLMLARLARL